MGRWIVVACVLVACERSPETPRAAPAPAPPEPTRVVLGECGQFGDEFGAYEAPAMPGNLYGSGEVRYGTIPSATGFGWSGPRGYRESVIPSVTMAPAELTGGGDKAITRRYLKRNIPKISYCYEQRLEKKPGISGSVAVTYSIGVDGRVKAATAAETFDAEVGKCIAEVVGAIEYPKQSVAYNVRVVFQLSPKSEYERDRELEKTAIGAPNPFVQKLAQLQQCDGHGTGVVDIKFDNARVEAVSQTVHGIESPCVAAAVAGLRNTSKASQMRCAFAFGTQSHRELKLVEVTETEVKFQGVALPHDVLKQRIETLIDRSQPPLTIWGPLAIEAAPTIPMGRLLPVILASFEANVDVVFVVVHPFGGKRVLGRQLPLPPRRERPTTDPKHTVHVASGRFALDGQEMRDLTHLGFALAHLQPHADPRIAVEFDRDATFGELARVIESVVAAGFTDWEL